MIPVYLKILEHIQNARNNAIYQESQSKLQKGFTPGCSSLNATLILTDCLLGARNNKRMSLSRQMKHREHSMKWTKTSFLGDFI